MVLFLRGIEEEEYEDEEKSFSIQDKAKRGADEEEKKKDKRLWQSWGGRNGLESLEILPLDKY